MSTATQRIIEDAWSGGFKRFTAKEYYFKYTQMDEAVSHLLLQPDFWQAVGKVRGWTRVCADCGFREPKLTDCQCGDQSQTIVDETNRNWHRFIDYLADGKNVEEALASIE